MKINSYESFCSHLYVSRETYEKFEIYYETLSKWQKSINLVSKSTIDNIWVRHFLDSGQLYNFTKDIKGNILDLGSGAGFPGLILAMMGNKNISVIESDQKKCTFMREIAMLTDTNVKIYNSRIEDLSFLKPTLITARALAPLNKLIKYVENYIKKSPSNSQNIPKLLFLKGKSYKKELLELSKTRDIKYQVYQSITDEFGKILYINNVNVLNIKNEKEI
ncbi:16S rRNA (guanine(527)-N(7))-methyltransferase RsmG [Alphaproteobacteria bacterium]|nr:16S rRNA (guanine(527)-N(7))-methyltransferase RsmG [Alphaproteobacteria bacterium]